MEEDMRSVIEEYLGELPIADVLPSDRVLKAQERRKSDGLAAATSLQGILAYLDFGDSYEALSSKKRNLPNKFAETLKDIAPDVSRLIAVRNRVAHTRPMEVDDSAHLLDMASTLVAGDKRHWSSLSETLARLSKEPAYVLGLTINLPADPVPVPRHNLPIPDFDETGFFGRKEQLRRIKRAIKRVSRCLSPR
jgi:hypothetical protein